MVYIFYRTKHLYNFGFLIFIHYRNVFLLSLHSVDCTSAPILEKLIIFDGSEILSEIKKHGVFVISRLNLRIYSSMQLS